MCRCNAGIEPKEKDSAAKESDAGQQCRNSWDALNGCNDFIIYAMFVPFLDANQALLKNEQKERVDSSVRNSWDTLNGRNDFIIWQCLDVMQAVLKIEQKK